MSEYKRNNNIIYDVIINGLIRFGVHRKLSFSLRDSVPINVI